MYIKKCPKCGRIPIIEDCVGTNYRRRICYDPCYLSTLNQIKLSTFSCVEQERYGVFTSGFVFKGEGDNNAIYKIWNEALIDE